MMLEGQVCAVSGGAAGIGWALCQALAGEGAAVYACDISSENLSRATAELVLLPCAKSIHFTRCDVSDRPSCEQWIEGIYKDAGRIDVLINNAAFIRWEEVLAMSVEDAERTMRVGYDAMVYTIKAVLPRMQQAGRGHIVNIGSAAGRVFVGRSSAAYAAVKAAIDAYSQILQRELQGSPIFVTLVRPATVAGTDFFAKHVPSSLLPRMVDFMGYLTPPDVARAVLRALEKRRPIVNVPGYLPLMYLFFELAPNLLQRLMAGHARTDFGSVKWRHDGFQK